MAVSLKLDDCKIHEYRPPAAKTTVRKVGDEEQALRTLRLAETYLASRKSLKAMEILKSIVAKYPKMKAAETARKHLKQLGGAR